MNLDDIDGGFEPAHQRADFALPEGAYKLEVVAGKFIAHADSMAVELTVKVLDANNHAARNVAVGQRYAYFLPVWDRPSADAVASELRVLGEDVDNWTVANGRPFSKEFKLSAGRVVGALVLAVKRIRIKPSGMAYHNLKLLREMAPDERVPGPRAQQQLDAEFPDA